MHSTRMKLCRELETLDALHRSASHITNAKQSKTQERPITETLEGSQVTVQPPPSVPGLLVHFGRSSAAVSFPSKTELELLAPIRSWLEGAGLNPTSDEKCSQGRLN